MMRARFIALGLLAALALSGCPKNADDLDGGVDAGGGDGGVVEGEACLDAPNELTRAPNGQLPCELLPPGFKR